MFRDEADVWSYIRPALLAPRWWWQRVEAARPDGIPDVLGMAGPRTVWIELKEGPVRMSSIRLSQRQWIADATRVGAEVYVLFGTTTGLRWFRGLDLKHQTLAPDFFQSERLTLRASAS